jgi:hypothetical protein
VRSDGWPVATILPRYLWVLGSNGRIDLRLHRRGGGVALFELTDRSPPLSPEPRWYFAPAADPFSEVRFSVDRLRELLTH